MSIDLEADVRSRLAAMADSLGDIQPPQDLPTPALPMTEPASSGVRRSWILSVAALVLVVCGIAIWTTQALLSTRVATPGDDEPAPPPSEVEAGTETDDEEPPTTEDAPPSDEAPETTGTWRPPYPAYGESLLPFDPTSVPNASLPDGEHFGILDRVADGAGGPAVRFSLGVRLTGEEAAEARAEAAAAAGVATHTADELAIRHDWWTPEWGVGTYIYPDFELPVSVPVDVGELQIDVATRTGPVPVTWSQFVDHAHGRGDLPYYWTGHAYITVDGGKVIRIESFYTP